MIELPDFLIDAYPCPQTMLDLFAGEWWSRLPPPYNVLQTGANNSLFTDWRINPIDTYVGSLSGKTVLELGPREAHHTYQYWSRGARVTAIEGNGRHFLKCLIIKELFRLDGCRFLCGDFVRYLRDSRDVWDVGSAIGVLYHQRHPLELLALLAAHCRSVHVWTHYYDPARCKENTELCHEPERIAYGGFGANGYRHDYANERKGAGGQYMGGLGAYSLWLERHAILDALEHYGFVDPVIVGDEWVGHGPSFMVCCRNAREL